MVNYSVICAMRSKTNSVCGGGADMDQCADALCGEEHTLGTQGGGGEKLAKANMHWVIKINNLSKHNEVGAMYHIVFDQNKITKIKTNTQIKNQRF